MNAKEIRRFSSDRIQLEIAKLKGWKLFWEPAKGDFPNDLPYFDYTNDERRKAWHIQEGRKEIQFSEFDPEIAQSYIQQCINRLPRWTSNIEACIDALESLRETKGIGYRIVRMPGNWPSADFIVYIEGGKIGYDDPNLIQFFTDKNISLAAAKAVLWALSQEEVTDADFTD